MKVFLPALIIFILMVLTINHGANTLNRIDKNMYAIFTRDCDKGTVKIEKPTLFNIPIAVDVEGWNCNGTDSKGQGYRAEIWDHFFWIGY